MPAPIPTGAESASFGFEPFSIGAAERGGGVGRVRAGFTAAGSSTRQAVRMLGAGEFDFRGVRFEFDGRENRSDLAYRADGFDDDVFDGAIFGAPAAGSVGLNRRELIDEVETVEDAANGVVATVETAVVGLHNKELGAGGILPALVAHADHAAQEGRFAEFVLDRATRLSGTVVGWIAVA